MPRMSSLRQLPNPFRIDFGYPQPEPFTRRPGGQVAHGGLYGSVPDFSFCNRGIDIHIQNDTHPPEQAQLRKSGEFLRKSGQSKPESAGSLLRKARASARGATVNPSTLCRAPVNPGRRPDLVRSRVCDRTPAPKLCSRARVRENLAGALLLRSIPAAPVPRL